MWVFGEIWCRGWLVTDVWISTASILNLCAISIDRYVAVTRPVKYRSIMTRRRAKCIVAIVWMLSFIICFPPLLTELNPSGSSLRGPPSSSSTEIKNNPLPTRVTAGDADELTFSLELNRRTNLESIFERQEGEF